MSVNLNNVAKDFDYRCLISLNSKNEAINLM